MVPARRCPLGLLLASFAVLLCACGVGGMRQMAADEDIEGDDSRMVDDSSDVLVSWP